MAQQSRNVLDILRDVLAKPSVRAFAAVALVALGVAAYAWRAQTQHEALLRLRKRLHYAMTQDTTQSYREVTTLGLRLIRQNDNDPLIRQMVTYAATILAIEHQDEAMLQVSRALCAQQPMEGEGAHTDTSAAGYLTAARILALYGDGDLTLGLALAESVSSQLEPQVMAKLESLRLRVAAKVDGPKMAVAAQSLGTSVNDEARALSYLGLWQLSQNNTAQAEQYLRRAVAQSPNHPQALLGLQWVRLFAPHPSQQDLWQAQKQVGDVLRLPASSLTPPVRATALLVRALATDLEGDTPRAQRDRAEALQLDPGNLLHEVSRDGPARP